jgi:hypothetical protein
MASLSPLLRRIARETTGHVLSESTRAAIERMAEEFARDMLQDTEFRELLRREARQAAKEIAASFRAHDDAPHPRRRR